MKNLVVVSIVEGVRRVAVPHRTAVPANWPEPWAAQCADSGEWWDNYDSPPPVGVVIHNQEASK